MPRTAPGPGRPRAAARATAPAALVLALLLALSGLAGCSGSGTTASGSASPSPSGSAAQHPAHPNIVYVLTDDLSSDLVQYMPHVRELQKTGLTFSNYTVTDSLCCPSRSSIFSGRFPHNTGVYTNTPPDGGFSVFHGRGSEKSTFATSLHAAGYRTAMMGKYLNGYQPKATIGGDKNYVPPGWDEWDVAGNGYPEFNYTLNEDHKPVLHGKKPADYLTDVLSSKGRSFISSSASAGKPFLLDIATFAPHQPATPAPRDRGKFSNVKAPRTGPWNTVPAGAPSWLAKRPALTAKDTARIDKLYRKRVRSVQAVDTMIGKLEDSLKKAGVADDTVFAFGSDNGFHTGQYRLLPGKMTAFDTDVHVPFVVSGPGIAAGSTTPAVASNIDICPTFEELGGAKTAADTDGRSLVPLLHGQHPSDWPDTALVEHHGPDVDPADPDHPAKGSGNPPSYEALRTARTTYVEYADGGREYYDRSTDPSELHNTYGSLSSSQRAALSRRVAAMRHCKGARQCLDASRTK